MAERESIGELERMEFEICFLKGQLNIAAVREAQLLAQVEELALELASIPAHNSNAFIRGTRAAGRRVRKLVRALRTEGGVHA